MRTTTTNNNNTSHSSSRQSNDTMSSSSSSSNERPSLPQQQQGRRRARVGDIVTIDLDLTPENDFVPPNGFLFDTQGEITFVVGWGNYLPGLHTLIVGMGIDESLENVSIDAGWGDHNPDLVIDVPRENFNKLSTADSIKVGSVLDLKGGIRVTVTKVSNDSIVVDANHPLAGSSYSCNLKVKDIQSLPTTATAVSKTSVTVLEEEDRESLPTEPIEGSDKYEVATFALGCFWSGELAFMRTVGVVGTKVGYTQGITSNPTYEDVCQGTTKHREAIMVIYDPNVTSYKQLLSVYVERLAATMSQYYKTDPFAHDDDDDENGSGTEQYKNGIYYHNETQRVIAKEVVIDSNTNNFYQVELKQSSTFYDAEEYHQQYLLKGGQSARKGAKEIIRCYG